MAFPLALLALMAVASASAGPIEVVEISPDTGLHFDEGDIDVQRHLTKRSPIPPFDPFTLKKKGTFFAKKSPKLFKLAGPIGLAGEFVPLAGAAGAGGLAGAAAPFVLEALPLGIAAFG